MSNPANVEILVTDRESIQRGFPVRCSYVLISIRDPGSRRVRRPPGRRCRGMLELVFHDAEPVEEFEPLDPITYMSEDDARAVWRFLREHEGQYRAILVHCEQGMSRSPAVAAALAQGLGLDESRFWQEYQPNQFVYRTLLAALRDEGSS